MTHISHKDGKPASRRKAASRQMSTLSAHLDPANLDPANLDPANLGAAIPDEPVLAETVLVGATRDEAVPEGAVPEAADALSWWRAMPREEFELLFERDFYIEQLDATESIPDDVARHYVEQGAGRLLSPNRLFEPYFYVEQAGLVLPAGDVFRHYIQTGYRRGLRPHPDVLHSAADPAEPILATLRRRRVPLQAGGGQHRRTPVAAGGFEAWRRACARTVLRAPLLRAVDRLLEVRPEYREVRGDLETVFDLRYYQSQLKLAGHDVPRADSLLHYVSDGYRLGFRPHPLFVPAHYLAQNNGDVKQAGIEPLLHYLRHGWQDPGRPIHPSYAAGLDQRGRAVNALTAFLGTPVDQRPTLSLAFADEFYRRRHPEVDWADTDALLHYLAVGALRGELPNPAFDPGYYADAHMNAAERESMGALEHFDRSSAPRARPFALFDPAYYADRHPDLSFPDFDASTHYLQFGVWEGRKCSAVSSTAYIHALFPRTSFAAVPPVGEYLGRHANRRTRLLFVGHEASRTGAPGILLKLVQHFHADGDIDCVSVLDQDGPLTAEHARVSHTVVPAHHRLRIYAGEIGKAQLFAELDGLMEQLADNPPSGVFCNSSEVRLYAEYFHRFGIPVIFLMHEIADLYPPDELATVTANCDHLVFPARFVADAFQRALPGDGSHHQVLPQGLLRDGFGDLPRGRRAELFRRWRLPAPGKDEALVLGCGTVDGRKGFDHFVEVARKVKAAAPGRVRFVWVGGRPNWRINDGAVWDTTGYWASHDIKRHGLERDIHVVPEVSDPEPFFVEADLFLLTSRVDPFPCVVHEAMASRLPVIGFAGTGGAPEAFLPDAGVAVDYPDTNAMARTVLDLVADDARRRSMGEAGRARVSSAYRFDSYGRRLRELMLGSEQPAPQRAATRPRVFFATPTWSLSGVGTFTEALVEHLNDHGFAAEILITRGRFGPERPNGRFYEPAPEMVPSVPFRMLQPRDLSDDARRDAVREFLLANAPCILVPNYDYVVSELARDLPPSVGIVGIAHSDDAEHYDHCYRLGPFWDRIVAVSGEIAARIAASNPGFVPRLETVRYGLPLPAPEELARVLAAKRASVAPIRLAYAGRFEEYQKRISDYVVLAETLAAQGVDFHLDLIGEGSQLEAVRRRLDPLVRAGRVSIPGRLDHGRTLERIRSAHAVLILSDFEGLPLCLVEGLQGGCVPVAYEMRSGIPEVIEHGVNGLIAPPGDVPAVAALVRGLQADRARLAALSDAALHTSAREELTLGGMGARYAALFQAVFRDQAAGLGRRPRG